MNHYLSLEHALLTNGILMPSGALVNETSIAPTLPAGCEGIEYFNFLLDIHEAILAKGLWPILSCPMTTNHENFSNFIEYECLYTGEHWPVLTRCAPAVAQSGRT